MRAPPDKTGPENGICPENKYKPYLPTIHFILLALVLLHQLVKYLLEAIRIGLDRWDNVLHRSLDQHAVNQPEAFAILREGLEGVDD